jgi:hypothetical protein
MSFPLTGDARRHKLPPHWKAGDAAMAGETVNFEQAAKPAESQGGESKYERSTIEFPYGDLGDAIDVANAIHGRYGVEAETDQVAAELKQSPSSGAFRLKTAAARMFGLTENERGKMTLTALGREILDPQKMRRSKADAFLTVPLYKAIYDQFRGTPLPPAPALERIMTQLGVASKQASRARQAFERSADQAGYFEAGRDRLVRPGNLGEQDAPLKDAEKKNSSGGGGGGLDLDPLLMALLRKIPASGDWPKESRLRWFRTFAMNVSQVYDDDKSPVEFEIKIRGDDGSKQE